MHKYCLGKSLELNVTAVSDGASPQVQPVHFCSSCQLYFGPHFSTQQEPGLWWGQDSGALRHWHHRKNNIKCRYGQTQLLPPKICVVSSASQTAVVSSDGELGKIIAIC